MSTGPTRVLLLSLRPVYSEAILDGSKHVELRRRPPRATDTRMALLYASSPVRALVGACLVHGVVGDTPARMWSRFGAESGVSRGVFMEYFADLPVASALLLGERWRFAKPVPLSALQDQWDGFHPPQSFRYLRAQPGPGGIHVSFGDNGAELVLPAAALPSRFPNPLRPPTEDLVSGTLRVEFDVRAA